MSLVHYFATSYTLFSRYNFSELWFSQSICPGKIFGPAYGLYWWMVHVSLRKMCLLLLLDGMGFYKCQLDQVDWQAGQSKFIITDFNSQVLSITEREVLKSSTIIADLWIYNFGSLHFISHILTLLLDACTFRKNMSLDNWCFWFYVIILFCTPRPNLSVTPGVSWLPTFPFQSP